MAVIRALVPSDEPALEAFLQSQLDTSIQMLSHLKASGLADPDQPLEDLYVGQFLGDRITGVIVITAEGFLYSQSPAGVVELALDALRQARRPLKAARGPQDQVDLLVQSLCAHGAGIQRTSTARLFSINLDQLIEPPLLRVGDVRGRPIQHQELDVIARWIDEAKISREPISVSMAFIDQAEQMMRERRFWVLKHKGELVACMGFGAVLPEAVQIVGVYVPPGLPKADYGKSVVAAALLEVRNSGVRNAVIGPSEEASDCQGALENLGFREAGRERTIILKESIFL